MGFEPTTAEFRSCIYILFIKKFETFWLEILIIHGILEDIVLNISSIYFGTNVSKSEKERNLNYSQRFFELYQVSIAILLISVAIFSNWIHLNHSVKIGSLSFFASSGTEKFHHLL